MSVKSDVVVFRILRKIRFLQHHAIPGPFWIDPMTMIFYSPLEKSYISLLSKKNDETIPLSLKKKCMYQKIHLIDPGGQTTEVFFKQHNNVDQSISVSQIMYSKSLGLDCQRFFFAALLPFQIPTPGIFPCWGFFFENFQSLEHRGRTHM